MKAEGILVLLYVGIPVCFCLYGIITDDKVKDWFIDMWYVIKQFLIKVGVVLAFICMMFGLAYACFGDHSSSNRNYDEEEIEDITDDPKWNIPSRYRD